MLITRYSKIKKKDVAKVECIKSVGHVEWLCPENYIVKISTLLKPFNFVKKEILSYWRNYYYFKKRGIQHLDIMKWRLKFLYIQV